MSAKREKPNEDRRARTRVRGAAVGLLTVPLCLVHLALSQDASTLAAADKPTAATAAEAQVLFQQRVLPLLKQKCIVCHGDDPKKLNGGLDLRTREGMLKGGKSGKPALVPGHPDKSPLYVAVTRKDDSLMMPPKENDKLSAEQVEWIRQWIAAGAVWPDPSKTAATGEPWNVKDGVTVATSSGRTPEWTNRKYKPEDIWAYQPITRPNVPTDVLDSSRVRNPVDAFIQQTLKAKGIQRLATPADGRTLLRRATFDLTGLPPTPEEIEAFLNDRSPDAFEKVIDRLLASPHYGEQMARHWLDVVRYADTSGFSNDFERPNAWRYRDYLIRSFNQDKPFDRFIVEQVAGDELPPLSPPSEGEEEKGGEKLIAAGFLRMGPWEHTSMTVAAVTRQQWLDDVTNHVGVTFLGQALRCAQCHDHKFDPVPTKDYYRIQAVFATTHFAERDVPFQPYENTSSFADGKALTERRIKDVRDILGQLRKKNQEAVAAYLKERGVAKFEDLPDKDLSRRDNLGLSKTELSLRKIYEKRVQYFERELQRYEPSAFSVYSGPSNNYSSNRLVNSMPGKRDAPAPAVHILTGGSLESPSEAVTPGVLSAMKWAADDTDRSAGVSPAPAAGTVALPETMQGHRLALARWIASPNNTLTARVIVNRVWQWHFGKGLVRTPNNFGKMGGRPTHPELLDWLAAWFIDHGWSIKKLHKLIMTSATYQQAGNHPDLVKLREIDSKNDLLAYSPPRRLAAEELRDSMLAVTGELNREIGGPGVFPEINWEVAFQPRHIMGSVAPAYQPSPTPRERNRRTVYAFRYRTLSDPMLEVFNRPGSEVSCERRDETTVTPQVFALFNSEFAHDRAMALAAALYKQADTAAGRIERAFRLVHGRQPTTEELKECEEHVTRMAAYHQVHPPKPTPLPTKIKRHMVEEMTGEDVHWDEELDVLKSYQRDLKPWDVGPETRALADVCLVLINSNEFLYLR